MTTRFGFELAEIHRLVSAVRSDDIASEAPEAELFARAAWSMLTEPGDRAAGLIVTALGAEAALDAVIEGTAARALADRIDPEATADRAAVERELHDGLQRWNPRLRSSDLQHAMAAAARVRARLLVPDDPHWPAAVDDLGVHGPLTLWFRGTPAALEALTCSIALVGARAATSYGEQVAADTAAGLSDRKVAVVSGAAFGIDGMAHTSTLASGGMTIAFLAGGVDRFYPAGHDALLGRIAEVGAVVSEMPCGAQPTRWRFLQRNRLIAAASNATVVLEAGWRSGSLNTAAHAASLGRPLGAVPGPVTSVTSTGCHRLIRDFGATCVTTVEEMLELVPGFSHGPVDAHAGIGLDRTSEQIRVLDALSSRSPRVVEEIARRTGMSVAGVLAALGTLDLDGAVRDGERGWTKAPSR